MRRAWVIGLVVLVSAGGMTSPCRGGQEFKLRDKEALYLVDVPDYEPIVLEVKKLAGVYASRNLNGHVRNVLPGEKVELLAYHEDAYFIREIPSGKNGWVPSSHLEAVETGHIDRLKAQIDENRRIQEAIKKHEVLPGMTLAQVEASLGKPTETSFRADENGRFDIWKFIEYKREYETEITRSPYTGQMIYRRVPIDIPQNETQVEFKDGLVSAIQKRKVN